MSVAINDDTSLPEAALALWERGFHVIPLGTPGDRPPERHLARHGKKDIAKAVALWPKTPRIAWRKFQTQQPTEEEVIEWWHQWPNANIGLLTGSVIVVDADSKEAVKFIVDGGITPSPWRVNTAKGAHFYYQRNPALEIRNSASKQRIDLRGFGGYVVAPPSVHDTGVLYEWVIDPSYDADSVYDLPILQGDDLQKIAAFNEDKATPEKPAKGAVLNIDTSKIKHTATGQPAAIGERNNTAASLSGRYIRAGLPMEKVKALLIQWNQSNADPLSMAELMTVVESVKRTHDHNNTNSVATTTTHDATSERPDPDLLIPDRPSVLFHSFGELQQHEIERPRELWGDRLLFSKARMLIAGAPKIGKTNFNLELAIRLACGGEMLGFGVNGPCCVAYLNAEVIDYYMRERAAEIAKHVNSRAGEMVRANLFLTGRIDLDLLSTAAFYALFDEIERIKPDVIIVDPLTNLHTANEDKSTEMMRVINRLSVLADINKSAIILAHHVRKGIVGGKGNDPFDAIRGTGALRGWADTNVMLYAGEGMTMAAFEVRNGPSPEPMPVWFDRTVGRWRIGTAEIAIAADHTVPRDRLDDAVNMLVKRGALSRGDMVDALQDQLSISERTAADLVQALYTDPRVLHKKDGRSVFLWAKEQ